MAGFFVLRLVPNCSSLRSFSSVSASSNGASLPLPSAKKEGRRIGAGIVELPLEKIRRPLMRTRENDPIKVKDLMESIDQIGLQVPIDVLEVDGSYYGFSGCHRYEAHQRLGLPTILCKVRKGTKETLSRAGFPHAAAEIFSLMQHMGCEPDRASYNIMVDAYGRAGLHEDSQTIFEEMKRVGITPTMKSHMLLLAGYCKAGNITKCEDILSKMHKSGLKPDSFVLNTMLNLYGRAGKFEKVEDVLKQMQNGSYAFDISTYNILINVYGRSGFVERMDELFRLLPSKNLKPDVVTWSSRIGAYSRKKLYTRCLEIFEEMIDSGCYPDVGTAKVVLSACSNEDQVEQMTTVIRTVHKDMSTALPI